MNHNDQFCFMVPRAIRNNVLVQVEWDLRRTMKVGSMEFQIDPEFDSNKNDTGKYASPNLTKQTRGRVVSLPMGYSPHFEIDNIVKEVQVGDLAYFHYNAIDADSKIEINGEVYYWVSYDMLFAVIRDGQIKMIGGRVLVDPIYDPDIQEIEVDGMLMKVKMTKSGIVTEINVMYNLSKATLRHIGTPTIGAPDLGLSPGDVVYYEKDADFENVIEGHKYFCMNQGDLLTKE